MKPVYINGIGNISPQATFNQSIDTQVATAEGGFFRCQEPKYKEFIKSKLLRRMSRIVKMGLATAKIAMEQAEGQTIDAIITGTAWGGVADTETFLETILENDERYLTPTAFVQSTHNTVGGQIALMHHNNCYNMTYVHGVTSFEASLLDAFLQIQENQIRTALVGGIDEQTEKLHILLERLDCASSENPMGEGAAFFVVSEEKTAASTAKISSVQTLFGIKDNATLERTMQAAFNLSEIDLVLTGSDTPAFMRQLPSKTYKQLCGDYPTSTAFATALAADTLKGEDNAKQVLGLSSQPKSILIYNHQAPYHSFILLEQC